MDRERRKEGCHLIVQVVGILFGNNSSHARGAQSSVAMHLADSGWNVSDAAIHADGFTFGRWMVMDGDWWRWPCFVVVNIIRFGVGVFWTATLVSSSMTAGSHRRALCHVERIIDA